MNRSVWLNRGTFLGLIVGVCLGCGGAVVWFQRDKATVAHVAASDTNPAPPAPEQAQQPDPLEAQKRAATKGCLLIAQAIDAYTTNPANDRQEPPTALADLVRPAFGGRSFLRNNESDLKDPWGKPYAAERRIHADGTEYAFVTTEAPDGTPISQFGMGSASRVTESDGKK